MPTCSLPPPLTPRRLGSAPHVYASALNPLIPSPPRTYTTEFGFCLANGSTPLHIAAELTKTEAAKAILRHHASHVSRDLRVDVDIRLARDSDGWTPFQVHADGEQEGVWRGDWTPFLVQMGGEGGVGRGVEVSDG